MEKITKKCKLCGKEFIAQSTRKRLCEDCVKFRAKETKRKQRKSFKKPSSGKKLQRIQKTAPAKVSTEQCRTCLYHSFRSTWGDSGSCDFITYTGKSRIRFGSPPDCRAYERYDRRKRAELGNVRKIPHVLQGTAQEINKYYMEQCKKSR